MRVCVVYVQRAAPEDAERLRYLVWSDGYRPRNELAHTYLRYHHPPRGPLIKSQKHLVSCDSRNIRLKIVINSTYYDVYMYVGAVAGIVGESHHDKGSTGGFALHSAVIFQDTPNDEESTTATSAAAVGTTSSSEALLPIGSSAQQS